MPIEVTARHMHATDTIQGYAGSKASTIVEEFPRIEHIHIILDIQKHLNIAEVVVQARNHIRIEAAESSDDMYASIDLAIEKVRKQLRKLREIVQDHKQKKKKRVEAMRTKGIEG